MSDDRSNTLITITNPRSPISEAYRTLRTNLEFSSLDKPIRSMVVTSAAPEEGKSTTLANLAVTIAQSGKKVILVDCDLRRPSLNHIFNARGAAGFTDMMRDDTMMTKPPLQETNVTNLRLLTSGTLPPNPSELLASRRMGDVIAALQQQADDRTRLRQVRRGNDLVGVEVIRVFPLQGSQAAIKRGRCRWPHRVRKAAPTWRFAVKWREAGKRQEMGSRLARGRMLDADSFKMASGGSP